MKYYLEITSSNGEKNRREVKNGETIPVNPGDDVLVVDENGEPAEVSLRPNEEDLNVVFENGAEVTLKDFYQQDGAEDPITVSLSRSTDLGNYEFNGATLGNLQLGDDFTLMRYSNVQYKGIDDQSPIFARSAVGTIGDSGGAVPANHQPITNPDVATITEDIVGNVDILSNDYDPEGGPLEIRYLAGFPVKSGDSVALPSGAIITLLSNGTVDYHPGNAYQGLGVGETATDQFSYVVSDLGGETNSSTVSVTITGENDAPTARDDIGIVQENGLLRISPLNNDSDPDTTDVLTVTNINQPALGTVTINPDNTVTFDPDGDFENLAEGETTTQTFDYTISDGNGGTDTEQITVTITGTNDAPIAVNDTVAGTEDTAITLTNAELVDPNDQDVDGDSLTITSVSNGTGGTVSLSGGNVIFTPTTDYHGPATFDYTISDGNGATDTATVTVNLAPVNDPPAAVDDVATTDEDQTIFNLPILSNDSDVDGDPLTIIGTPTAGNGTVTVNPDGTINYTPDANFNGPDTINYTIGDGNGATDTATVSVTVNPVNDAPIATNNTYTGTEDTTLTGNLVTDDTGAGIDSDPEGNPISVTQFRVDSATYAAGATANLTEGDLTINSDGSFSFVPAPDYNGTVPEAIYTLSDGTLTDTATLAIGITSVNDLPTTHQDSLHTIEGLGQSLDVIMNDDDAESSQLTVTEINGSAILPNVPLQLSGGAIVSLMEDGQLYYNPNGAHAALGFGETATDTFSYSVTDDDGGKSTENVTVVVDGVDNEVILSGAYQVITATLYEIQLDPYDESINYVPIGSALPFAFNSIAFNANDNLIYANTKGADAGLGVANGDIIQIDPLSGQVVGNLGQFTNDQGEIIPSYAGVINSDLNIYYVNGPSDSNGNTAYAIDLNPGPDYLSVSAIGSLPGADYGVDTTTGLLWSISNDSSYSLDPTSGTLTSYVHGGLQADGASPANGTFGSVFSDGQGNIQTTSNSGYGLYRLDPATGSLTRIGDAPASNSNDATGTLVTPLPSAQPSLFLDADGSTNASSINDSVGVYNPGGSAVSISDSDTKIADLDGDIISSAKITLTNPFSGDELVIGSLPSGITGTTSTQGGFLVATLSGNASQADYEDAIKAVSFQNSGSETVLSDVRQITVTVTDVENVTSNPSNSLVFIGDGSGTVSARDTQVADTIIPDSLQVHEDDNDPGTGGATLNLLTNDSDSPTSITGVTQPPAGEGSVTNNGDGTITFQPGNDFQYLSDGETATTTFTYTTDTGKSESVTVTVHGANDPITAIPDSANASSNSITSIDVLANDSDPDTIDQPLSISALTQPSKGSVSTDGSQVFFDPGSDFSGLGLGATEVVTFIYTVSNASGEVENEAATVTVTGTGVPPLVIDLDGDGVEFSGVAAGIEFDVDHDGHLEQTAWAGHDDAVLIFDANNNNEVDESGEFAFANYSDDPNATDLQGLAEHFDTDNDRILSAADDEFTSFKLWQDSDGDGVVGDGEMVTLDEAGIESIELTSDGQTYTAADGDVLVHGEAAVHFSDGSSGVAADAEFDYSEIVGNASAKPPLEIVTATGEVHDLDGASEPLGEATPELLEAPAADSLLDPVGDAVVEGGAPSNPTSAEDDAAAAHAAMS